jgi:hypothetical protein
LPRRSGIDALLERENDDGLLLGSDLKAAGVL